MRLITAALLKLHATWRRMLVVVLVTSFAVVAGAANIVSFNLLTGTRNSMAPQDLAGSPGVRTTNWRHNSVMR